MAHMKTVKEFEDPNEVKVVVDKKSDAIYFSREAIPSRKKGVDDVPMLKQVCIIPFKRDYLLHFNKMEETELERIESVDMMRIIENGDKVRMVMTQESTLSVDTEEDRQNVECFMEGDHLMLSYANVKCKINL
jgi:3-deoxy-manno-octulosonate cytidylyltransferase (CMP-KDO synthetase)